MEGEAPATIPLIRMEEDGRGLRGMRLPCRTLARSLTRRPQVNCVLNAIGHFQVVFQDWASVMGREQTSLAVQHRERKERMDRLAF